MTLNSRRRAILTLFLEATTPLTSAELAARLDLTPRIVRYNLNAVERWLAERGVPLTRKPNYGFSIDAPRRLKADLLHELTQVTEQGLVLCPAERVAQLLLLLLTEDEPLQLKQLQHQLGVSRNTSVKDLAEAETWLQRHRLSLVSRPHFGFQVSGEEAHIRAAIVSLLLENVEPAQILALCGGSRLEFTLPVTTSVAETYLSSKLFKSLHLSYARTLVGTLEDTLDLQWADHAYAALVLHTAICIQRVCQGKHAKIQPGHPERSGDQRRFQAARVVADRIEQYIGCHLTDGDAAYIALHLAAASVQRSTKDLEARNQIQDESELGRIVDAMIDKASAYLHPWLKVDQQLFDNLVCHLRPTWHRLQFDLPISNPLLKDIKEYDEYLFQVAGQCADVLAAELGKPIPIEEIGYVAMHLGASLERIRPNPKPKRRVLVVCGEGSATAWLLASRLRAEFPSIEIVAVLPLRQVSMVDFREVDAVVSTAARIENCTVPVRMVSPLLPPNDVERLRQLLVSESIADSTALVNPDRPKGLRLCDLITRRTIALDVHCDSWLDVIDKASSILLEARAVGHDYARAVKELIFAHGPYMVSAPGLVLLHARPGRGVRKLAMGLVTLDPPIDFGHPQNDPVKVVLALAAADHHSHRRALRDVVTLVQDSHLRQALSQAASPQEVCDLLRTISEAPEP